MERLATDKQLRLIKKIEFHLDVKFEGKTVGEATKFISKHLGEYREKMEFIFDAIHNECQY